ncbi:MAG: glycerophosphodiester phosphodiesterase [Betaproteobacteria bacterium]|nr:glycerophosphodiester phosphodiesterase [Betaproteobacteria bacterium]
MASVVLAAPVFAFDLQGHRGARGLAPENTLAAFRLALDIGVTTLETDLAVTQDGVLVLAHDPYLNPDLVRGPDGRWLADRGPPLHTLTLAELKRYDIGRLNPEANYAKQWPQQRAADGERPATLVELFDLIKRSGKPVRLNLETKLTPESGAATPNPPTFARLVVDAVRASGMAERVTVQSFDWRTLRHVHTLAPEIGTACLTIESENFDTVRRKTGAPSPWHAGGNLADHTGSLPKLVHASGCRTWSMFWRNLTQADLAEARTLRLTVLPWTVNDPAEMARLIDWGVDGIITDYPNRLRDVMTEKKLPLP